MVCLRNISVDTLHKGDTEDNNDNDDDDNNNHNNALQMGCNPVAVVMHVHKYETEILSY